MITRDTQANAAAVIPLGGYGITVSYGQQGGAGPGWFGPLAPMTPVAPPSVKGRRFDFPSGYNLNQRARAYERIGFDELRALADNYDLLRIVIETRKDQVERLPWRIAPREDEYGTSGNEPSKALLARSKEIRDFLRKPDKRLPWAQWTRELLEDLFVIDAPSIYKRPTRGGSLFALEVINGATIKPIIDDGGRMPLPPLPAYQQVLKGMPASEYRADELIYRPRNVRSNRVYGFSPVEQIVMTVNIALRRQLSQMQYYTEGNIPEALIGVPDTWTPEQVSAFQQHWDETLEGSSARRRHAKFVPGGVGKTFIPTKEPELKNVFDEWLARVVCFSFSIPPSPFVAQVNRATAETAQEQSLEEGLEPVKQWLKDLIDDILIEDFGETDLEFRWGETKKVDPDQQATRIIGLVGSALMRPNEGRAELGLEIDPNPAADMLGIKTGTGFVPIEALTIEGKQANLDAFGPPEVPGAIPDKGGASSESGSNPGGKVNPLAPGKPDKPDKGATEKFAKARIRIRRPGPVPFDRPAVRKAIRAISLTVRKALVKAGQDVAAQIGDALSKVAKDEQSNQKRATDIAAAISLRDFLEQIDGVSDNLAPVAADAMELALAQVGVTDRSDLVNQVNDAAVEQARAQAAELVTRIDEATRNTIRDTIADGLEENIGTDEIADAIAASTGFSADRADLIARTEVSRANSDAVVAGYAYARDNAGVKVKKEWLLGENPCDICEANAEAGPIDVDDEFPSGDDAPPGHPNCECAVAPVVEDEQEEPEN